LAFQGDPAFTDSGNIIRRTIADTNFVTTWVIAAFLLFELSVYIFGLDLKKPVYRRCAVYANNRHFNWLSAWLWPTGSGNHHVFIRNHPAFGANWQRGEQ
jgi:hypothetical protein